MVDFGAIVLLFVLPLIGWLHVGQLNGNKRVDPLLGKGASDDRQCLSGWEEKLDLQGARPAGDRCSPPLPLQMLLKRDSQDGGSSPINSPEASANDPN